MNKKLIAVLSLIIVIGLGIGIYYELNQKEESEEKITAQEIEYEENNVDFSNSEETTIDLNNVDNLYNITNTGIYHFTGNLNGYIKVNTTLNVQIILDNVTITNDSGPCIYAENVNNLYIEIIGENTLTDSSNYNGFDEADAVIYSKDDLIIYGEGILNINGNYLDGIVSKDDLVIESGTYNINTVDDGIRGKDSVVINNGTFNIKAGGDAIKSTNDNDSEKGNILIQNGVFSINSNGDGISSENNLQIDNGSFNIITSNGAKETSSYRGMDGNSSKASTSSKAIKASNDILIKNGTFDINSYDDSIHSDNRLEIDNGTFEIKSSDDAIHADSSVLINGGTINITSSYEGIEANNITINDGNIKLIARDDGINVSGGNDNSGYGPMGRTTNESSNNKLTINGGTVYVNSSGDGLDANGSIYLNGGVVYVDGPTDNGNGSLDYDGFFEINGGVIITSGSSGMMQNATSSNQSTILIYFDSTQAAGTKVSIGNISYTPSKSFSCLLISSNELEIGNTYEIKLNNTKYQDITISNNVMNIGNGNSVNTMGRGGMRGHW